MMYTLEDIFTLLMPYPTSVDLGKTMLTNFSDSEISAFTKDWYGDLLKYKTWQELAGCTELDLSKKKLKSIPIGIKRLTALQALSLYNNQITAIPDDAFSGLTALQYLDLHNNQITAIPDHAFSGLTALQALYLFNNQITKTNITAIKQLLPNCDVDFS